MSFKKGTVSLNRMDFYGTKSHGWSRDHGKNARPESTSCCLRAAVDRRSRQPEGSRRRSRAGILARGPRTAMAFLHYNPEIQISHLLYLQGGHNEKQYCHYARPIGRFFITDFHYAPYRAGIMASPKFCTKFFWG